MGRPFFLIWMIYIYIIIFLSLTCVFIYLIVCRSGRDRPLLFREEKVGKNSVKGCRYLPPFDYTPNSV